MKTQTNYLEVLSAITRGEKTYWTRIGTAFPTKEGKGFRLKLDYFPVSGSPEIVLMPQSKEEPAAHS